MVYNVPLALQCVYSFRDERSNNGRGERGDRLGSSMQMTWYCVAVGGRPKGNGGEFC